MTLTVLICTHNRVELLANVLASLNAAARPTIPLDILVVANNCRDGTHQLLADYQRAGGDRLPLQWLAEPTPGKSHALNRAIPQLKSDLVAFVDDDHRIDHDYFRQIETAATSYPNAGIFCGRILPDWTGAEPAWVHDEGPYRIYPLPVPRYDQGLESREITAEEGPVPGGGNLVVRLPVLALAGRFSTELGPHGHDLGGGEDSEYVLRALRRGAKLQYCPGVVQYHYVDLERLTLPYILRKGFQRTRSSARIGHAGHEVPLYMWRKLLTYLWSGLCTLSWAKRRFYLVRGAAALGELQGMRDAARLPRLRLPRRLTSYVPLGLVWLAFIAAIGSTLAAPHWPWHAVGAPLLESYPIGPLFQNQAVIVALFSYAGKLFWGLNADAERRSDLADLRADLERAFDELAAIAALAGAATA